LPPTQGVSLTFLKRPVNGYAEDKCRVRPQQMQCVFHLMAALESSTQRPPLEPLVLARKKTIATYQPRPLPGNTRW